MNITNLSAAQLRHAADLQEKIAALQNELAQYLGESSPAPAPSATTGRVKRKFRMSAEGRARIIAAQKARWAKVHAAKGKAKPAKTGRRTMSSAARAKIAAIARARWAKVKAAGKKAL